MSSVWKKSSHRSAWGFLEGEEAVRGRSEPDPEGPEVIGLPSEDAIGLPDAALVNDLHVGPKQQAVDGSRDPKVIRLETQSRFTFTPWSGF